MPGNKGLFMAKSKSTSKKAMTSKSTTKSKSKTTTERKAPVKKTTTQSAGKPAGKKAPAKKSGPAAPAGIPMIDTNLAAQAAASMLINRETIESAEAAPPPTAKESGAFKNFKEQIARPKPSGLSNLFGPGSDMKKSGGHFNVHQQKGHNQTFGGMNKTGVPRRTNG
jgi:hypothetical protein